MSSIVSPTLPVLSAALRLCAFEFSPLPSLSSLSRSPFFRKILRLGQKSKLSPSRFHNKRLRGKNKSGGILKVPLGTSMYINKLDVRSSKGQFQKPHPNIYVCICT